MDPGRLSPNPPHTLANSGSPAFSGFSASPSFSPQDRGHYVSTTNRTSSSSMTLGVGNGSPIFSTKQALSSLQNDPSWSEYVKRAQELDKEMLHTWTTSMDTLLVFAGLFSAILTAFLAISIPSLRPDATQSVPSGSTPNTSASPPSPSSSTDSTPTARTVLVHFCWFISLSLSILTAAVAMLAKSWCLEYSRQSSIGSRFEQAQRRQARYTGLVAWRMPEVMDLIPSLLYIAIILYMVGLCQFLADIHTGIAIAVLVLFSLGLAIGFGISILAAMVSDCPYRTPFIPIISSILKASLPHPIMRLVTYLTLFIKSVMGQFGLWLSRGFRRLAYTQVLLVHGLSSAMDRWSNAWRNASERLVKGSINGGDIAILCSWPFFRFAEMFFILAYAIKWIWNGDAYDTAPETEPEKSASATDTSIWHAPRGPGSNQTAEALAWWIRSSGDPVMVDKALKLLPSVIHNVDDRRVLIEAGVGQELARSLARIYGDGQRQTRINDAQLCEVGNVLRFLLGPDPDEVANPSLRRDASTILSPCLHYLVNHQRMDCQVLGVSLQTCLSSEADFSYDSHLVDSNPSSSHNPLLLLHCALDTARRRYHRCQAPTWGRPVYQTNFRHIAFINGIMQTLQTSTITRDIASAYLHALRYELSLTSKAVHMADPSLPDLIMSVIDCLDETLYRHPVATVLPSVATQRFRRSPGSDIVVVGRTAFVASIASILAVIHSVDLPREHARHDNLKEFVLRQMKEQSHHEIQRLALLAFHKHARSESDYHDQARQHILAASTHVIEHATATPEEVSAAVNVLIQVCRRDRVLFVKSMSDDRHRIFGQLVQQAEGSTTIREALLRLLDVMVNPGRLSSALYDLLGSLPVPSLVVLVVSSLEQGRRSEKVVQFGLVDKLVRHPTWAHAMAAHSSFLPYVTQLLSGTSRTIRQLSAGTVLNLWVAICGTGISTNVSNAHSSTEPQRQAWITALISSGFLREFTSRIPEIDIFSIALIREWFPLLRGLSEAQSEGLHGLLLALRATLNNAESLDSRKKASLAREWLTILDGLGVI